MGRYQLAVDTAFKEAVASLRIEGQELPAGGEDLIKSRIKGVISEEDFLQKARELAKL